MRCPPSANASVMASASKACGTTWVGVTQLMLWQPQHQYSENTEVVQWRLKAGRFGCLPATRMDKRDLTPYVIPHVM